MPSVIPTVFILCAGSSSRMGGEIKQLLYVMGEPMIRRTIRQIREHNPDIKIYVITWRDELKFKDVFVIDTKVPPRQMTDSISFSRRYWREQNIFLVGDAVYGDEIIKDILEHDGDNCIFYKDVCPNKNHTERFAWVFSKQEIPGIEEHLDKTARIFANTQYERCCGLWKICYATYPEWLARLICPVTYTNNSHPYLRYIRPFRDFFVFHIHSFWKPQRFISLIKVDDSITTDIDTPEEYEDFVASGVVV